jgi:hypothetical protein
MGCLFWLFIVPCVVIVTAILCLMWAAIMMSTLAIGVKIALFGATVLILAFYLVATIVLCKY